MVAGVAPRNGADGNSQDARIGSPEP